MWKMIIISNCLFFWNRLGSSGVVKNVSHNAWDIIHPHDDTRQLKWSCRLDTLWLQFGATLFIQFVKLYGECRTWSDELGPAPRSTNSIYATIFNWLEVDQNNSRYYYSSILISSNSLSSSTFFSFNVSTLATFLLWTTADLSIVARR